MFACDLDNDGHIDISYFTNMYGNGTFGEENVITTNADGASMVIGNDLNNDGDDRKYYHIQL